MFILKVVKVLCFDTLLQVLILKVVMEEQLRRRSFSPDKVPGCPIEAFGYPHPGCFGKRGCKLLILWELRFLGAHKRLQEHDKEGVSLTGGPGGRIGCRGNTRQVIISVYRLSSIFLERCPQ